MGNFLRKIIFFVSLALISTNGFAQDWHYLGEFDTGKNEFASVWYDKNDVGTIGDDLLVSFFIKYKTYQLYENGNYNEKMIRLIILLKKKSFFVIDEKIWLDNEVLGSWDVHSSHLVEVSISDNPFVFEFLGEHLKETFKRK
jgi:hypothetical protein